MNKFALAVVTLLALGCTVPAWSDESSLHLKNGPDLATVRAHCSVCHSVDYIQMNAPFMKKAGWEAEVRKMMKAMGAPIPEDDVGRIVAYLTQYYGVE